MEEKIILYSSRCPKCIVLEKQLQAKNIPYEEINDVPLMLKKGINAVPVLEVNGELLDFGSAWQWMEDK